MPFEHMMVLDWIDRGMEREAAVNLYNEIFAIEIIEGDDK